MQANAAFPLLKHFESAMDRFNSPVVRRVALIVAAVFLIGGLALAIADKPDALLSIDYKLVLLCLVLAGPLSIFASALEFGATARLAGVRISASEVLQVTIIGSAANLLPIPGAMMVRIASIKAAGASLEKAASATTFSAALWPATGCIAAGFAAMALGYPIAGAMVAAAGLAGLVGFVGLAFMRFRSHAMLATLVGIKALQIAVEVGRLSLCLAALGGASDLLTSTILNMSNVIGSIVTIVPAGLGVREGVGVALAPILSLSASLTFLAVAINRILGLLTIAPVAILLAAKPDRRTIG